MQNTIDLGIDEQDRIQYRIEKTDKNKKNTVPRLNRIELSKLRLNVLYSKNNRNSETYYIFGTRIWWAQFPKYQLNVIFISSTAKLLRFEGILNLDT